MSSDSSQIEELLKDVSVTSPSSENEGTELMETTSPSDDFSSKGKRKNEFSDHEGDSSDDSESESQEEESTSDEEEEKKDSKPEWDKDSYDGREYHSDENELSDKEADLKWRRYKRQLIETKGFYIDPENIPPGLFSSHIIAFIDLEAPSLDGLTRREFCTNLANVCLDKFNQQHGLNVRLENVLWVNYRGGSRPVFFITFVAKEFESPDAPLVEYQAKVLHTFLRETYPILCRPSPNPKWVREELKLKELTKVNRNEAEEFQKD
ncbi:hypothetical protein AALP_AA3G050100 [Arabis alpina]|uniref:Uncharacterized protein n=1 Tax=Arabis alpina TaxID=50452 RepID=A0A087H739_ARAAL|nr:hypothetical protein AALP_AA3G050100 [Arabis alpina]